ncbi:ABC transporter ATP-binding protein [Halalkalirubrum salinum]|uniref:ABC transporter ATP-binding protein n=1 Tax=Halalkalirubrum salinum TaxID=2563889 RepID=UPI0010FB5F59|nr:sn-glycerol-3-phosphate ABC transporter ATP-binding protein UgpC [Halalkalirubrum salinum]
MATIELQDVRKEYEDVVAVNDVDLTVEDGEFLVLVGPSGCGKSTTLRLIAGLETCTNGELSIGETVVNDHEPKERDIAMVFQNYALFPHMTARKNITFGMQYSGSYTDEEIDELVSHAAEVLDIAELLDRKPSELSGGEKQRVAMGRSLVRDPEVFLMDEPLSNLDAKLRVQMRTELSTLHEQLGTTTVYVTHDQIEAMTLGTRVAVMNKGKIEQIDPPQQLYDFPETRFVAEFIGSPAMNIIEAHVSTTGPTVDAVHEACSIPLPQQSALDQLSDGHYLLGVRPEDFTVVDNPTTSENEQLDVHVDLVESLGDTLLLHTSLGNDDLQVVSYQPGRTVERGDMLTVTYDPDRLHLFDPETGEAVYHSGSDRRGTASTAARNGAGNTEMTVGSGQSDRKSTETTQ